MLQQELIDANVEGIATEDRFKSVLSTQRQENRGFASSRGRTSKADPSITGNLSISLDFLQQPEEEEEEISTFKQRGRKGPGGVGGGGGKLYSHLQSTTFWDSPDLESPVGSEKEWKRSLVTDSDPIYKTSNRSSSREPPGSARISSSFAINGNGIKTQQQQQSNHTTYSPHIDSSSPSSLSSFGHSQSTENHTSVSLGRSASTSRAQQQKQQQQQQQPNHLVPWSNDSGSPLRLHSATESTPQRFNGNHLSQNSNTSIPGSIPTLGADCSPRDHQRPSGFDQRSFSSTNISSPTSMTTNGNLMSTSPDQSRASVGSPQQGLPTMPEEAMDSNGFFQSSDSASGFRAFARHRSTSSAAALQHADYRSNTNTMMAQRGNSADTFSRSISLWRGEFGSNPSGGMSPGTYAHAAHFQQQQQQQQQESPTISSRSSQQLERGRKNGFMNIPFSDFPEEDVVRESNGGESESRRHSIAAAGGGDTSSKTALTGQRRAIGFEVRNNSVGRVANTPRASNGGSGNNNNSNSNNQAFGLFGGGTSGFSEDDLAADLNNLHVNLDSVVAVQQRQNQDEWRRIQMRVPSSNAATSGVHAASMPPIYGGQGEGGGGGGGRGGAGGERREFSLSPPLNNFQGKWPVSARLLEDEGSSPWGDGSKIATSPPTTKGGAFVDYGYQQPQHQQARLDGALDLSGMDDRKSSLSATAKAFHGSAYFSSNNNNSNIHPIGPISTSSHRQPSQDRSIDSFSTSPSNQFHSFAATQTLPQQQQQQPQAQLPSFQQQHVSSQRNSNAAATLSEVTIASLVTLGPLAPASGGPNEGPGSLQELGKGVPLQMLPRFTPLYIVEFKEGRTDLYFRQQQGPNRGNEDIQKGDLVIVEADRGKDLGTVVDDSITVDLVQSFLSHQAELAAQITAAQSNGNGGNNNTNGDTPDAPHPAAIPLSRLTRSINPKRLFSKAGPADTSLLHSKAQDEERALTLCSTKVNQRGLPMSVVAAEMQWDRRKLTFYYTATQRVDFRDLVKELFRLYKTRIWMCHLSHPSGSGIPT